MNDKIVVLNYQTEVKDYTTGETIVIFKNLLLDWKIGDVVIISSFFNVKSYEVVDKYDTISTEKDGILNRLFSVFSKK